MTTNRRGFTIVELTIAIAFVGVLLVAVVSVAVGLGRTYQKGITMRDVNQSGREISDSLRRDIASADPSQLDVVTLPAAPAEPNTVRICTGSVSYLINFAQHLIDGSSSDQIINSDGSTVRLTRVVDNGGANCQEAAGGGYDMNVLGDDQQELLGAYGESAGEGHGLAVHDFSLDQLVDSDGSRLYSLDFMLGTNQSGSITDRRCENPNSSQANFDFCALYEFETIIRAGYGGDK